LAVVRSKFWAYALRVKAEASVWMQNACAQQVDAIAGGMPIEIAQQNLGHASLATTTVYVTTERRRRMKAVDAFWKG
jgi:integrase